VNGRILIPYRGQPVGCKRGGQGAAEVTDDAVYLAMSIRNAGSGVAVLHGWRFHPTWQVGQQQGPPVPDEFTRLSRDIYVPAGDVGFWQGAFRDPSTPEFAAAAEAVSTRTPISIDVMYGDHEGGQRAVTRFLLPGHEGRWIAAAGRHWNIDRDDPR